MNIGERIKYCRTRAGLTQNELAQLSGIHPVSIRKYETNKTVPQDAQIIKISESLGISPQALTGYSENTKMETVGDFIGFLIFAIRLGVIQADGERDKESDAIAPDTFTLKLNPIIAQRFVATANGNEFSTNELKLIFKNFDIYTDFIKWEKLLYRYKEHCENYKDSTDENVKLALEKLKTDLEKIEIELQSFNVLLDTSHGLTVKMPPYRNL